ncbi:MAG: IS630 family transposase [Curvibacter sp.]
MSTKTDARKLNGATQAHLRKLMVKAVRGGMTQTEAAATYGVSLRAVSKWMKLSRAGGLKALKAGKRGRRPGGGRLNTAQAARIRALIVGKMPDQLKLSFYLWTREAVAHLIEREYDIAVSPTTVGRYLKAWGMSAQKPVRRAYERNDAAIARWLEEDYPAIAKDAKREKATIYWGDEMGLRSDHVSGTSFAPLGKTPVVRGPDELLNQDVKTNALGKSRPTNKAEMVANLRSHLHRRQKQPHLIRSLFQEQHVRYAA